LAIIATKVVTTVGIAS